MRPINLRSTLAPNKMSIGTILYLIILGVKIYIQNFDLKAVYEHLN